MKASTRSDDAVRKGQGESPEEDSPKANPLTICSRTSGDEGVKKTSTRHENAVRDRPEGGAGTTIPAISMVIWNRGGKGEGVRKTGTRKRQRSAEQTRGRRWGVTTSDFIGYLQPHER